MKDQKPKGRPTLTDSEIETTLKKAAINPTAQRIAICRYVLCEADHPTAEEVKNWVDKNFPKMSMATVYNTLGALVNAGLLREVHLANSECVIYDNLVTEHYHFLDIETGKVLDIMPEQIDVVLKLKRQLKVQSIDVLLRGIIK